MEALNIHILGTGTSQGVPIINCDCEVCTSSDPKDNRLRSSIVVSRGDTNILIDTSPDFRMQMLRQKIASIDAVLYTHEHNDHVAGLDDLRPFVFKQQSNIPLFGMERVINAIKERFPYAFGGIDYPGVPSFDANIIAPLDTLTIDSMSVECFEVIHGKLPILGYRIEDFVYITDAKYLSEATIEIAKYAKVLIINALRKEPHWSHFNLEECLAMIEILQPQKAYITHISHLMGKANDIQKELPNNVYLAYDGMELRV